MTRFSAALVCAILCAGCPGPPTSSSSTTAAPPDATAATSGGAEEVRPAGTGRHASASASAAPPGEDAGCQPRAGSDRPVIVSREAWQARKWRDATKLSQLKTSRDDPMQACGLSGTSQWLANLHCDDETRPVSSAGDAKASFVKSVGRGGRCDNDIRLYRLACAASKGAQAETFDIFIDRFWCVEGEEFVFDVSPFVDY
jgi:hypothetical protein